MELKPGYKQTEVGVIPEEWEVRSLGDEIDRLEAGVSVNSVDESLQIYPHEQAVLKTSAVTNGQFLAYEVKKIVPRDVKRAKLNPRPDSIIISRMNTPDLVGECGYVDKHYPDLYLPDRLWMTRVRQGSKLCVKWLAYVLSSKEYKKRLKESATGTSGSMKNLSKDVFLSFQIAYPSDEEQRAIAAALSDVDALIASLDKIIAKKRDMKQAAMQELLTGKRRLPGFSGEWEVRQLGEMTDCLDNLRVPLNESQRDKMRGDYPYCGANGILDYVNDYVIDADIILMAEDGGYFDEYSYRPIAYRMTGKCWVNNHAHVLRAKNNYDQGFLFYSLVHKNILNYLASGTRAKLNKSEMNKIEIHLPVDETEQTAIATILSDMDAEISELERKRDKTRQLKQGMMQELLTGRIRLV